MTAGTVIDSLQAADPARNASVHASAGTGKTWLLVTRIIRLLLADVAPDSILAITFTRKAAAEMQQRLTERLRALMAADPPQLDRLLVQCGVHPDADTRRRARQLYEESLFNPYSLRATTFHAFCQELLQRFPLEAGIAPGFAIIEAGGLLEQAARDALVSQTARQPGGEIAQALEVLVDGCESLDSAHTALRSFLSHRSDWWAFIEDQPDAYAFAADKLTALLGIEPGDEPLQDFPDEQLRSRLQAFAKLLGKNTTKTNTVHADMLATALASPLAAADLLAGITPVFFKADGDPRTRKASAAQSKRLGETGEIQFLELDETLTGELERVRERCARFRSLRTNLAWYTAGMQLLKHFQRIKQEQRLLDFSDLEWMACRLLNRSDHASWVQYKLDTRIDHLLVDEFQDTNPTQWRLLLPLLEELAAGTDERCRSVFLVGDRKQSIYSFRRANPALLDEASNWLEQRLQAERYPLDASRRSARAIIDCVNTVFGQEPLQGCIREFNPHTTYHEALYGHVEILPLATAGGVETKSETGQELRNPLETPRLVDANRPHYLEGGMIAARIRALIAADTLILEGDTTRRLDYGDIIILLRQRTHAMDYERALREAGIPYASASRGELLDNLEVRDLEALLHLLISPFANLELAQVLRSPVFGLDSEQLLPLAGCRTGTWYERLGELAADGQPVYLQVYRILEGWRALTGKIPVHDLLDRIYHEADIMQRYQAAFPPALRPRVEASLTRFIELALELDNGRYPSLPHFLDQLTRLRQTEADQPDEGTPDERDGQRVRLLTIHGAKGLEAGVIFLADAAAASRNRSANEALVRWPPGMTAPDEFLLTGKKTVQDPVSRGLLESQQQDAEREDANLLYVALTRARQYLFISGSEGKRPAGADWYSSICAAVADWKRNGEGHLFHQSGKQPAAILPAGTHRPATVPDPRLGEKIPRLQQQLVQIAPSKAGGGSDWQDGDADGRERGIAIHAMLEWLAEANDAAIDALPARLANTLGRAALNTELQTWWQEALGTWRNQDLARVFDPGHYQQAMNEVPVQFMDDGQLIYGIIDRVVIRKESVLVIDYKTRRAAGSTPLSTLAEDYQQQMQLYARAAGLLWPEHTIEAYLLFTHSGTLVPVSVVG